MISEKENKILGHVRITLTLDLGTEVSSFYILPIWNIEDKIVRTRSRLNTNIDSETGLESHMKNIQAY